MKNLVHFLLLSISFGFCSFSFAADAVDYSKVCKRIFKDDKVAEKACPQNQKKFRNDPANKAETERWCRKFYEPEDAVTWCSGYQLAYKAEYDARPDDKFKEHCNTHSIDKEYGYLLRCIKRQREAKNYILRNFPVWKRKRCAEKEGSSAYFMIQKCIETENMIRSRPRK